MNQTLPIEISHLITIAKDALLEHPNYVLMPFYRCQIYQSINNTFGLQHSHLIKTFLSILATERVLPFWNIPLFMYQVHDEEYDYWLRLPHYLIETSLKVIGNKSQIDTDLRKEAYHLTEVNDLTGQLEDSPYYHEWCVFDAALGSFVDALNLDLRRPMESNERIKFSTSDDELNHRSDTAILACLAYSGGDWTPDNADMWVFDKKSNRWITDNTSWYFEVNGSWNRNTSSAKERRKQFWMWWLSEAIHEAWQQSI